MKTSKEEKHIARRFPGAVALLLLSALPLQAVAYVGPGLGAGTLGVILGLVGSVLLAVFAFFWYPIKRALFGNKAVVEEEDDAFEYPANEAVENTERSNAQEEK